MYEVFQNKNISGSLKILQQNVLHVNFKFSELFNSVVQCVCPAALLTEKQDNVKCVTIFTDYVKTISHIIMQWLQWAVHK